jgi:nucleoside-diphosphate-sugar epimerase
MKKVLVTGASGLLAINIIEELLNAHFFVFGFLRNPKKFPLKNHQNLELIIGDISQSSTYLEVLKKTDIVIHVAAKTGQNILQYKEYKHINVNATKELLTYSIENNVQKFIYISSANAFGYGDLENLGNETKPIKAPFNTSLYAMSKLEAQNAVLELAEKQEQTKIMVLNPTFLIGKYDTKPSSGRIILSAYKKKIIFYPPGGKSFINVKDAAQTIVKSIEFGKHKESYILSGENLSFLEFYKKVNKALHQKSSFVRIPKFLLIFVGYLGNALRFFGLRTDLSLSNLKTLSVSNFYSNRKAKNELHHQQNKIEEGIEAAIKWFDLDRK